MRIIIGKIIGPIILALAGCGSVTLDASPDAQDLGASVDVEMSHPDVVKVDGSFQVADAGNESPATPETHDSIDAGASLPEVEIDSGPPCPDPQAFWQKTDPRGVNCPHHI